MRMTASAAAITIFIPTVCRRRRSLTLGWSYTDTRDPEHINYGIEDYDPLSFDRPEPICHIPEEEDITGPIEGRSACHIAVFRGIDQWADFAARRRINFQDHFKRRATIYEIDGYEVYDD